MNFEKHVTNLQEFYILLGILPGERSVQKQG